MANNIAQNDQYKFINMNDWRNGFDQTFKAPGGYLNDQKDEATEQITNLMLSIPNYSGLSPLYKKAIANVVYTAYPDVSEDVIDKNLNSYVKGLTGADLTETTGQEFVNMYEAFDVQGQIADYQNALMKIPEGSPLEEFYENEIAELQTQIALKTKDFEKRGAIGKAFIQFGGLANQRVKQITNAIETAIVLGVFSSAASGSNLGVNAINANQVRDLETMNKAMRGSSLVMNPDGTYGFAKSLGSGFGTSMVKYGMAVGNQLYMNTDMMKMEMGDAYQQIREYRDEEGNRVPKDIAVKYATDYGISVLLSEQWDEIATAVFGGIGIDVSNPFTRLNLGKGFFQSVSQVMKSNTFLSSIKFLAGRGISAVGEMAQEAFQAGSEKAVELAAIAESNRRGYTKIQQDSFVEQVSEVYKAMKEEFMNVSGEFIISTLLDTGTGFVSHGIRNLINVTPKMRADADAHFNPGGKVVSPREIDTMGAEAKAPEKKVDKDGKEIDSKLDPILVDSPDANGIQRGYSLRDRQLIQWARENKITGIRVVEVPTEMGMARQSAAERLAQIINEEDSFNTLTKKERSKNPVTRLSRKEVDVDTSLKGGPIIGTKQGTLLVEDEAGLEKALDYFRENSLTTNIIRNSDGSTTVRMAANGDVISVDIRLATEAEQNGTDPVEQVISYASLRDFETKRNADLDPYNLDNYLRNDDERRAFEAINKALPETEKMSFNQKRALQFSKLGAARIMPIVSEVTGMKTKDILNKFVFTFDTTGKLKKAKAYGGFEKIDGKLNVKIRIDTAVRPDTIMHEVIHGLRTLATKEQLSGFAEAYGGTVGGMWVEDIKETDNGWVLGDKTYKTHDEALDAASKYEERFVDDFMRYLYGETGFNDAQKSFFAKVKQFFEVFWDRMRSILADKLDAKTVKAFDILFGKDTPAQERADFVEVAATEGIKVATELASTGLEDETMSDKFYNEEIELERQKEVGEITEEEYNTKLEDLNNRKYEAMSSGPYYTLYQGYDWDRGMSNNAVNAYENGENAPRDNSILHQRIMDRNTQARIDADYEAVENALRADASNFDSEGNHLAPNGEKSYLTYKQWVQVRTPAFMDWFGDWLNDPENASKIVDENGEPKVVFHGATAKFDTFAKRSDIGFHFGTRLQAEEVLFIHSSEMGFNEEEAQMLETFLNIRNPITGITDPGAWTGDNLTMAQELLSKGYISDVTYKGLDRMFMLDDLYNRVGDPARMNDVLRKELISKGYDGIIYTNLFEGARWENGVEVHDESYMVFNPNQIKSATDNVGTFDSEADSILYQRAELPLDYFRKGGIIRYGQNGRFEQDYTEGTQNPTGLRGYIEYGLSDRGDSGLLDRQTARNEVESGSPVAAKGSYLTRGDISSGWTGRVGSLLGSANRDRLLQQVNAIKGSNYVGVVFYELNKETKTLNKFIKALNYARSSNPTGLLVSPKSLKELKADNVRVYMSGDGNTGYAIEYDHEGVQGLNNLVAVFNTSFNGQTTKGAVYSILADAIEHGANILDCYANDGLVKSYSQMGFVPTGTVKFTDEYLSDEEKKVFKKNKGQMQKPVVAMYYADRDINETIEKFSDRMNREWYDGFDISKYNSDGYDSALRERDAIARDYQFGQNEDYRNNPENYRLGTRVGGTIGSNPSPISEATGHGLQNWEKIEGREDIAEKVANNLMGGAYKVQKDGTELKLPVPIPVRRKKSENAIKYLRRVTKYGAENIKTIFDSLSDRIIEMEKKWYDTAHAFAQSMAQKYNLSIGQSTAIIAVLSPNYVWDNNLTLADIVLDILDNASDSKPSAQMIDFIKNNYSWDSDKLETFSNKTLSEMSLSEAKEFVFVAIQSGEIDKSYMSGILTGQGLTGESGQKFGLTIGTGNSIEKAISVYRDGSITNISDKIGSEAKVRSFYNNILIPGSDRAEITADTWALRDFFLGMNPEYAETMRGILFGGQGGAGTGLTAVINEGFRIATDMINEESGEKYLPQQIQSIVWTGIKAAWDNATAAGMRDALNNAWNNGDVETIRSIFRQLVDQYQTGEEVRPVLENQNLSHRSSTATIFREGSKSAEYNKLGAMIESSYQGTRQAAQEYSDRGGRKSLSGILFQLSDEERAEALKARENDIREATLAGKWIRTEYVAEFAGQEWADNELYVRNWMAEDPVKWAEFKDKSRDAKTYEDLKKALAKEKDKDGNSEWGVENWDADDERLYKRLYQIAQLSTPQERDSSFIANHVMGDRELVKMAKTLREYSDLGWIEDPNGGDYANVLANVNRMDGVSDKVLKLNDKSTSAEIAEARQSVLKDTSTYRNAFNRATNRFNELDALDENLEGELNSYSEEQINLERKANLSAEQTDWKKTAEELEKKLADAEADLEKLNKDNLTLEQVEDRLAKAREELKAYKAENKALKERQSDLSDIAWRKITEKNEEIRELKKIINAFRRREEARAAREDRKKMFEQIKNTLKIGKTTFGWNSNACDAKYLDAFSFLRGLFAGQDRSELIERRHQLISAIDELKTQNAAQDLINNLEDELEDVRAEINGSEMKEVPAILRPFTNSLHLKADNRISKYTTEELSDLLTIAKALKEQAKRVFSERYQALQSERSQNVSDYFAEIFGQDISDMDRAEIREAIASMQNKEFMFNKLGLGLEMFRSWNGQIGRFSRHLDGKKEGVLYNFFTRVVRNLYEEEQRNIQYRLEAGEKKFSELGLKTTDLNKIMILHTEAGKKGYTFMKDNGEKVRLTVDQAIGVYIYGKNEDGLMKLRSASGNGITEEAYYEIIAHLTPEQKAWGDWMMAELESHWQDSADTLYNVYNMTLGKVENYFTFKSEKKLDGKDEGMDIVTGSSGDTVRWVNKGYTKERVRAIYPLDLHVSRTWANQVRKEEHFVAFAKWGRDANYYMDTDAGFGEVVEKKFGPNDKAVLAKYVKDVISPGGYTDEFDKVISTVIGRGASAMVAGNLSVMAKQIPTLAAAVGNVGIKEFFNAVIARDVNLDNFLKANQIMYEDYEGARKFINDNSPVMKGRKYGTELIDNTAGIGRGDLDNATAKLNSKIMRYTAGLTDSWVTSTLWLARYMTVFNQMKAEAKKNGTTFNIEEAHKEAVFKAGQLISETQNTSVPMDLSYAMRQAKYNPFMKPFYLFSSTTMNLFNQIFYDIPYYFKNKDYKGIAKVVAFVTLNMVGMLAINGAFHKKKDEDDEEYAKRLAKEVISQSITISVPGFGGGIASAVKGWSGNNGDISLLSDTASVVQKVFNPSKNKTGWENFVDVMSALGYAATEFMGLPANAGKKLLQSAANGNPGYLINKTWGEIVEDNK